MRRRFRAKEAFLVNPPRRMPRMPLFRSKSRYFNPFKSRGHSTGLDRYNAMRETEAAIRRYESGGIVTKVSRKRKRVSIPRISISHLFKKGGKKAMAKRRVGRPRHRGRPNAIRLGKRFGTGIKVKRIRVVLSNPKRRRYSRSRRRSNPMSVIGFNPRRRSVRRRRNPVGVAGMGSLGLRSVTSLIPLGITAGIGVVITKIVPVMVGITSQYARYGTQVAVGVVGGMLVGKFVGKEHGVVFGASAVGVVIADLLGGYLFGMLTPAATTATTAGMGSSFNPSGLVSYPGANKSYPGTGRMGAFPNMGAYPNPYQK